MPPQPIIDLSTIDLSKVVITQDEIYQVNPHRYEFKQLDGIVYMDWEGGIGIGIRDLKEDEFWVKGHIPGRPLFPGVLMMESAAQLVSFYAMSKSDSGGFLGFAGVENVKFRGSVVPGQRIHMVGEMIEITHRRCIGNTQAFVDGTMVFEGTIKGMWM